jgi:hypothetical protein
MVEKKQYRCDICNKSYKDKSGLWYHNTKNHKNINNNLTTISTSKETKMTTINKTTKSVEKPDNCICKYCGKQLSHRNSRWRHEKICEKKISIEKKLEEITQKLDEIQKKSLTNKKSTKIINNINGNIVNGTNTDNSQKIIINKTGNEDLNTLTYDEVSVIFDNQITSVIKLIESLNFDEKKPQNHSFCTTSLESPYLSYYDNGTNSINKERKKYFFDEIICKNIENHEILYNKFKNKFNNSKKQQIQNNITNLKEIRANSFNNKIMQELVRKLNLLSYNKRNIVHKTWNGEQDDDDEDDSEFVKMLMEKPDENVLDEFNNIKESKPKKKLYISDSESDNESTESSIDV